MTSTSSELGIRFDALLSSYPLVNVLMIEPRNGFIGTPLHPQALSSFSVYGPMWLSSFALIAAYIAPDATWSLVEELMLGQIDANSSPKLLEFALRGQSVQATYFAAFNELQSLENKNFAMKWQNTLPALGGWVPHYLEHDDDPIVLTYCAKHYLRQCQTTIN